MGEMNKTIRIPLAVDMHMGMGDLPHATGTGGSLFPVEFMSYMKNLVADKDSNGEVHARLRPRIRSVITNTSGKTKGRGIFFKQSGTLYIVNDNTVYRTDYGTTVGTITTGASPVYWAEMADHTVLIDTYNNQGWTIDGLQNLVQIADSDFPASLAGGVVELNGRCYVLDRSSTLYNSASDDPTSWGALDFISAERSKDSNVFITKHHDHIVVFGQRTIEFFYDNANPTGSPLSRRSDVFYNVGAMGYDSVYTDGDVIYFLSREGVDGWGFYKLENFNLIKISKSWLDAALDRWMQVLPRMVYLSEMQGQGKRLILLNFVDRASNTISTMTYATGEATLAYDVDSGMFSLISTALYTTNTSLFPVMGAGSFRNEVVPATGNNRYIFPDGEIYTMDDDANDSTTPESVDIKIRTGWQDGGTNKYKYCRSLEVVGNAADDVTLTLSYSDTSNLDASYTVSRTVSLLADYAKRKLTRLGRFVRRNFQLSATVTDDVRLSAVELEIGLGDV